MSINPEHFHTRHAIHQSSCVLSELIETLLDDNGHDVHAAGKDLERIARENPAVRDALVSYGMEYLCRQTINAHLARKRAALFSFKDGEGQCRYDAHLRAASPSPIKEGDGQSVSATQKAHAAPSHHKDRLMAAIAMRRLMDMPLPENRKTLGKATYADLVEAANYYGKREKTYADRRAWFKAVADRVKASPDKRVEELLTEQDLRGIGNAR